LAGRWMSGVSIMMSPHNTQASTFHSEVPIERGFRWMVLRFPLLRK
jgi:hypothetical protein